MQALVPIGTFETKARKLLGAEGFDHMLDFLARAPMSGLVIKGTGGLRKVRIARPGQGKSGGARVIYYYHGGNKPILLMLIYGKANQENLTDAQRAHLKRHVDAIVDEFG